MSTINVKSERGPRPWSPQWMPRDNARLSEVKVKIRQSVLAAITPEKARVFDAFAGAGEMWKHVWKDAADYVGCDEKWHDDDRCCYVGDNHRVMRAIDLAPFSVFDFDAWGSPWDQLTILAARRKLEKGETMGLVLTDGTWLKTRAKDPVRGLRQALPRKLVVPIPYSVHDEMIARALRRYIGQMGGTIERVWRAIGTTGAKVRYIGIVVRRL